MECHSPSGFGNDIENLLPANQRFSPTHFGHPEQSKEGLYFAVFSVKLYIIALI